MDITVTAETTVHLYCDGCGKDLEAHQDRHGDLMVEPCRTCLNDKYEEGYDAGQEED